MTNTDVRHANLHKAAKAFLRQHRLHPDSDTYLAHGYVNLCLRAWPTAAGGPLHLATKWAIWTWVADDVFDQELSDATPAAIEQLVLTLLNTVAGANHPGPADHPIVQALADLVQQTQRAMPDFWRSRYREQLASWIHAAAEKLTVYVQPGRTPTLREYLAVRPADGGMLLAAMWTELAEQCITPDWRDPLVQSLLAAFSACGCLTNDLAAAQDDQDTFTAVYALVSTQEMTVAEARTRVKELLQAEEYRFWWLYTSVRRDFDDEPQPPAIGEPVLNTSRFALTIDRFRRALTEWTAGSSRYTLPAQLQEAG
ncbi:terpene synthase family protein [Kitasatospora sp. NPDC052896]|uniref:terpene synthase family protein n=1 Tax=Kitasatospora sp. NPDC052896 TaxID=3364061 RepID=UPI0037C9AFEA